MKRHFNTTQSDLPFAPETILKVWQKAYPIINYDPNKLRRDKCGRIIQFSKFGDRDSIHGWEIDHVVPIAKGGNDNLENLQPLHWQTNGHKGDRLDWKCS